MKVIVFTFLLLCISWHSNARQTDSSVQRDTSIPRVQVPVTPRRTVTNRAGDSTRRQVRPSRSDTSIKLITALPDTAVKPAIGLSADTSIKAVDTTRMVVVVPTKQFDPQYSRLLIHPYLPIGKTAVYRIESERRRWSKDELFYVIAGLLLFLALTRMVFSKYFKNIFRLFFQPSFRQKQTREQLLQSNLPSLIFNLFFIAAGGIYIALLLQHYHLVSYGFWLLFAYCTAALAILYTGKYLFVLFSGWVFNVKEAADTYIFVVYLINKIVGIIMVPFILVIAFSPAVIMNTFVTISVLVLACLYLYRYVVSYVPIRREIMVSPFHFLFYICAFEVIPLLLIYKLLMLYLARTP